MASANEQKEKSIDLKDSEINILKKNLRNAHDKLDAVKSDNEKLNKTVNQFKNTKII